ncbi:unnamed protein product [Spirodela intermedia]|nr:unnamed protein product [Spirodela intermedia]CAA6671598.1 unnamed protein product [Spirodela intermedia]
MMNSQKQRQHRRRSWDEAFRPAVSASSASSSSAFSRNGNLYEDIAEAEEATAAAAAAGFAVEKQSSDPREDFRCSMLEMIMEQQIFGEREMENLLHSYLSLNPPLHHSTIVEVFLEIRETLFGETLFG